MSKKKPVPRRSNDADDAPDEVVIDGRSLERLAELTGMVIRVPVEEVRAIERKLKDDRTRPA